MYCAGCTVQDVLSRLYCPGCTVQDVMSRTPWRHVIHFTRNSRATPDPTTRRWTPTGIYFDKICDELGFGWPCSTQHLLPPCSQYQSLLCCVEFVCRQEPLSRDIPCDVRSVAWQNHNVQIYGQSVYINILELRSSGSWLSGPPIIRNALFFRINLLRILPN